jgi:16S rRNA (cytosine967-C5)-methyltransferase
MLAVDIDDFRLEKVEENLERLSLQARTMACDITLLEQWYEGEPFDRILCDVPCSASGVIRRHPDIKLLRQADDIKALVALQSEILQKLWGLLKPGGILLYATCSILPEENSRQIKQFLSATADALEEPIHIASAVACEHGMQLLPNNHSHDGFYYAKLRKNAG